MGLGLGYGLCTVCGVELRVELGGGIGTSWQAGIMAELGLELEQN